MTDALLKEAYDKVLVPMVAAMKKEGMPYVAAYMQAL